MSLRDKLWPVLGPALKGMWGHRWVGLAATWIICVAGWIAVVMLPTAYESSAKVYVNAAPILTPLLRGLAADTDPTRQLDFMRRTLLTRPNLEEAARLADVEPGQGQRKEELLQTLAATVRIDAITPNLIAIAYRAKTPRGAKDLLQALLTVFAEKTTGTNRKDMDATVQFLQGEIAAYQEKLRAADQRRAELIRQYPDLLPLDKNGNRLDQIRGSIAQLQGQLSDAKENREMLQKQLAVVPPVLAVDSAPQVYVDATGKGGVRNLQEARQHLLSLKLQYTDEHPDVIAARRQIAELEAEAASGKGASGGASKAQVPNAVYNQLKLKLSEVEATIPTLERKLGEARAEEARVAEAAQKAPDLLARAQDMDRDYGLIKTTYDGLVQRLQAAQIADAANTKTDQIQFRIVEPPQVPVVPAAPNRPLFYSLVLVVGLAGGLAVPLALVQLDRSISSLSELRGFGIPVLGSVTFLVTDPVRRRNIRHSAVICASTIVLVIAYGTLVVVSTTGYNSLFGVS